MSVISSALPGGASQAAIVFLAALFIGWVVDQLIYRLITSRTAARGWAPGRALADGLRGLPTAAGALIGAHYALQELILSPSRAESAAKLANVVSILVVTGFGARILGRLVRAYTEREGSRLPSTSIFVNIARATVWVLGGISVLAALGVSIAPLITALGVGGLAIGLALQPTLENVFSGIQVLASRQIEPGDLIRLETGEEGAVLDVTWRNTTIITPSNDVIIVPNAVLGRSRITNFSTLTGEHVLIVPVVVSPQADTTRVEQCVREVAEQVAADTEGVVSDAPPTVRFATATAAGVQVNVGIRVKSYPDRIPVRHELIKRLQPRLVDEGFEPSVVPIAAPSAAAR